METNAQHFGIKTRRLEECSDQGLTVPPFLGIPCTLSQQLFVDEKFRQATAQDILDKIPATRYAVRSSALIEDSEASSFAGQFETKLNVAPADLSRAIYDVLNQAHNYLDGALDSFSLLIQEYIAPDYAGVVFTRSPLGNREMIIEYAAGSGEQIVGGKIQPKKVSLYNTQDIPPELTKLGITQKQRTQFYNLEKIYGGPQDIEWCIKNNTFYFLQTRPITTITPKQYDDILFVESILPQNTNFYYAKTEITEIAPCPDQATRDLLEKIYATDGPVDRVYKKHHIKYSDTQFLVSIGDELFVDKEKELRSLLPSYTYFVSPDYTPRIKFNKKFFLTLKNIFHLNTIQFPPIETVFNILKNILEDNTHTDFENTRQQFLHNYECIFETNLLCGIALKKLEFMIKKEKITPLEILDASDFFLEHSKNYTLELGDVHWKGNTLAFNDDSNFSYIKSTKTQPSQHIETWWANTPQWKKQQLKPLITNFILYNRFREYGRWAVVKQINELRNLNTQPTPNNTTPREYSPTTLTQKYISHKQTLQGVSSGTATGILVTREDLDHNTFPQKNKILYTTILSPDLTKYFDTIQGIISEQGGMLSHLAIVAREHHIPVIVNFTPTDDIQLGDSIFIDANYNKIQKIQA